MIAKSAIAKWAIGKPPSVSSGGVTHATSGVVVGNTANVVGEASRSTGSVTHPTSGVIVGNAANIVGAASRVGTHPTSGVVVGNAGNVVGVAARTGAAIIHDTSGIVVGNPGDVVGAASNPGQMTLTAADIQAIVNALIAAVLPVNIVQVNYIDVDGTGQDADPWGPV
jgi:hypothetical protein